jgi:parallel beta-helix repeat protein
LNKAVTVMMIFFLVGSSSLVFDIHTVKAERTWTVDDDGPADFQTIQEAINNASEGDTIYVKNGTYYENVVMNKNNLTLVGENKEDAIIDGGGGGSVIRINANNILVSGFTMQGSGISLDSFSNENNVSGNIIRNYHGAGIYLSGSDYNHIEYNMFTSFSYSTGISLDSGSDYNVIRWCIITNSEYGIKLGFSGYNTMNDNNLVNNTQAGIYLKESIGNTIGRSNLTNNRCGIYLDTSGSNVIQGNTIAKSDWLGIYIYGSGGNIIYNNNFINNSEQVYSSAYENIWDNSYLLGGNYWNDYVGVDTKSGYYQDQLGSDGLGDIPFIIDVSNQDRFPLMAPINIFDIDFWDGEPREVHVVSGSGVSNFRLTAMEKVISLSVTGADGTASFCRMTIPNIIIQDLWQGNYTILLSGGPWPFRNWTDTTNTYLYINYTHSQHQIVIVPEFPSFLVLPLFMITTLFAVIVSRRRHASTMNSGYYRARHQKAKSTNSKKCNRAYNKCHYGVRKNMKELSIGLVGALNFSILESFVKPSNVLIKP